MTRKLTDHPLHKRPQKHVCDGALPLYKIDEIPSWMRDNPYILGSYRAGYTFFMCLRSIFALHNETMNVWTHLLGFLFFTAFGMTILLHVLEPKPMHYFLFTLMSLSCMACLGCSTCFHLFSAHYNERVCRKLHTLDYFGVTCLIIGSFVPTCYFAFACQPQLKWTYLAMIFTLGSVGLVGPFYSFWTTPEFHAYKMLVYTFMVGSGVFPIIHVNFIMPPSSSAPFAAGLALEIFLYLIGMLIYIFKVPERFFPGRFDVWFHSHQIWHVFVLLAATVHFFTVVGMYMHWETMEHHC